MKKVILLLFLTLAAFHYSQDINKGLNEIAKTKQVQQYILAVKSFISERGLDSFVENTIQNTLGTTLQVVSNVSSNNPAIEDTLRLLEKHIIIRLNTLPPLTQPGAKEQATDKIQIVAGDSGVNSQTLKSASSIVNEFSLPILQANVNMVPTNKAEIVLFSSSQTYGDALVRAGLPSNEVTAIVSQTGGIAVNSSIWIPLYNIRGKADLANVLTHELTHVAFNQAGIGHKLPLWINEGLSWFNGLAAQEKINPTETKLIKSALKSSVIKASKKGQLLPLGDIDQGILNAPYNVEFQAYMATDALIKKYGLEQFKQFLNQSRRQDVNESFRLNFKASIESYEKEFDKSLR